MLIQVTRYLTALLIAISLNCAYAESSSTTLPLRGWRDDGGFANSPTKIKNGKKYSLLQFKGFSQVYAAIETLKKDKVYDINLDIDTEGQVESIGISLRKIGHPWTSFGSTSVKDIYGTGNKLRLQVRMKQDMAEWSAAVFMGSSGTGTIKVNSITVVERDDFLSEAVPDNTKEQLIANGTFSLGSCGWRIDSENLKSDGKNPLSLHGKTNACSEDRFTLYRGRKYPLVLKGSGRVRVLLCYEPNKQMRFDAVIKNGIWQKDIAIPIKEYGEYVKSLTCYVKIALPEKKSVLDEITLGEKGIKEASFLIPKDVRRWWCNIGKGQTVDMVMLCRGFNEGEKVEAVILDSQSREITSLPLIVEKLQNGCMGSKFKYTPERYGWLEFRLRHAGKIISGPSAELSVLPPESKDGGDFVFGCHSYNYSRQKKSDGTLSFPLANDAEVLPKLLRKLGFTGNRAHPPSTTKWRFVEQKKGVWNFHDSIADSYINNGIDFLGTLDTTAIYASSAPEKRKNVDGHAGAGAYPARDIEEWKNYVRKITRHYKGRVFAWEVWNEPDHVFLQLNPDVHKNGRLPEYIRLLKAAYTAAKEVDPNLIIAAGAVTAGGKSFLLEGIDQGMLDYCDAISFHGYGRESSAPAVGGKAFADMVGELTAAMEKRGKIKEIWDTESGGTTPDGRDGYTASLNTLKSILARRASGLSRYYMYSAFTKDRPGHSDHRTLLGYNSRPLILESMCAAYAYFLGDAKIVAVKDEGNIHLYGFENKNGTRILSGWSSGKDTEVNLPGNGKGKVYDQFANPVGEFAAGKFKLTGEVKYFVCE